MPSAADFFKSNWINAKSLEPGVRYEATIVGAAPHTFEDGNTELTIRLDYLGKGASSSTRARNEALIAASGSTTTIGSARRSPSGKATLFFRAGPRSAWRSRGSSTTASRLSQRRARRSALRQPPDRSSGRRVPRSRGRRSTTSRRRAIRAIQASIPPTEALTSRTTSFSEIFSQAALSREGAALFSRSNFPWRRRRDRKFLRLDGERA